MFKRSLYTLIQALKYRKKLKKSECLEKVTDLTSKLLDEKKIKYLALDFDGVLASHGKQQICQEVKQWLDDFAIDFCQCKIFILSNKPTQQRLEYFNNNYPDIRFISGVAKKPYPDGLIKIKNILGCDAREIALIDDRILTGCLACLITGSYPILITKPYLDQQNYTLEQKFFSFLRYWEQKIFLRKPQTK